MALVDNICSVDELIWGWNVTSLWFNVVIQGWAAQKRGRYSQPLSQSPPFYLRQVWDLNPHYKFAPNFSLTKNYLVRCGVRTHALSREPELKSGALDLSANLTLARNSKKRLVKKKVVGCRGCDNQPLFHCWKLLAAPSFILLPTAALWKVAS